MLTPLAFKSLTFKLQRLNPNHSEELHPLVPVILVSILFVDHPMLRVTGRLFDFSNGQDVRHLLTYGVSKSA